MIYTSPSYSLYSTISMFRYSKLSYNTSTFWKVLFWVLYSSYTQSQSIPYVNELYGGVTKYVTELSQLISIHYNCL